MKMKLCNKIKSMKKQKRQNLNPNLTKKNLFKIQMMKIPNKMMKMRMMNTMKKTN